MIVFLIFFIEVSVVKDQRMKTVAVSLQTFLYIIGALWEIMASVGCVCDKQEME